MVLSLGAMACGDDNDEAASPATATAGPDTDPDPEADPEAEAGAITPAPKPPSARQVDVTLKEWEIKIAPASLAAGKIYFLVENAGPEDAHEFVVIKTDLAPDALPTEGGQVPETEAFDIIDEIEPFEAGSTGSIVVDLAPGAYVLICNIAELHEGRIESHYEEGMRTAFTVTP